MVHGRPPAQAGPLSSPYRSPAACRYCSSYTQTQLGISEQEAVATHVDNLQAHDRDRPIQKKKLHGRPDGPLGQHRKHVTPRGRSPVKSTADTSTHPGVDATTTPGQLCHRHVSSPAPCWRGCYVQPPLTPNSWREIHRQGPSRYGQDVARYCLDAAGRRCNPHCLEG